MENKKKLLVVVDMQKDFIDGALGSEAAQAIVDNVVRKIKGWDGLISATLDTHGENYLDTREGKHLPVPHCIAGTDGHKMHPDVLAACQADADRFIGFVHKGQFGSLMLPDWVRNYEVEYVEFIGLCTDICVVSNALMVKNNCPEIDIAVDAACCAGVSKESHDAALLTMKTCQIEILNWHGKRN